MPATASTRHVSTATRSRARTDAATDESARSSGLDATTPVRRNGCTCARVRRLARRMTQLYDHALAPCGLRVTQYSLLTQLIAHDDLAIGPLADALDMDRTTLTRNLKLLIDAKLLALAPAAHDGRVRVVRITRTGRTRYAKAAKLWREAQDEVDRTLGQAHVASLHRLFDGLIETFNDRGRVREG